MKKSKDSKEESNKEKKGSDKTKEYQPVQANKSTGHVDTIKELQQSNQDLVIEVEELKKINEEQEDFIKRQKAEFDNYRKRVLEEKEKNIQFAGEGIMKNFLTIYDNYSKALQVEVKHEEVKAFLEGFKIIKSEMDKFMEEQKVSSSTQVGDEFDPNIHQAILFDESSEVKNPLVTEIFQEGYLINDRLLRTAMVKVTKPVEKTEAVKSAKETDGSTNTVKPDYANKTTEASNKKTK